MPEYRSTQPLPACDGLIDRRSFLPRLAAGRKVLHLGCVDEHLTNERAGTGALLHEELAGVSGSLCGVDISLQGLKDLAVIVPGDYVAGDVERLAELELPVVDLVIAAELIEHLKNPGLFLEGLRTYLTETSAQAVITTPNAYGWVPWAKFAVGGHEATHPDHRLLYSPVTLDTSLERSGLRPVQRFAHRWHRTASLRSRVLDAVDLGLYRRRPWLAPGLVYTVEPA